MGLESPLPEALERGAPVIIDAPFGDLPIPRAAQSALPFAVWSGPANVPPVFPIGRP